MARVSCFPGFLISGTRLLSGMAFPFFGVWAPLLLALGPTSIYLFPGDYLTG